MDVIITYETLYEILRREKYRAELQYLENDFFQKVTRYLGEKESILESQQKKTSIFASVEIQKTQKQIENIKRILKELYERRENKIIQMAVFASRTGEKRTGNMLKEEEKIYGELINVFSTYREGILHNLLTAKMPKIKETIKEEAKKDKKLLRFLKAIPKFVAEDLNVYGPFEEEDMASLPEKTAMLLVEKKKAEEVKIT